MVQMMTFVDEDDSDYDSDYVDDDDDRLLIKQMDDILAK